MRRVFFIVGNTLLVLGLLGLTVLAITTAAGYARNGVPGEPAIQPIQPIAAPAGLPLPVVEAPPQSADPVSEQEIENLANEPVRPITRLRIDRIRLDTEVVLAKFVEKDGGTWDVPAFKAGHAEFTAGAGQSGNAVLVGHVTSLTLGNVFQELERVRVGDRIEVVSGAREFDYQVTEVRVVPRTEVSVIEPTENASISLITCTGVWLPHLRDYADRLVVRGELQTREPSPDAILRAAQIDEPTADVMLAATELEDELLVATELEEIEVATDLDEADIG